jgi:hypothetical protein
MSRIVDEERALSETERDSLARETEPLRRWHPARLQKWIEECDRRSAQMESGVDPGLTLDEFWADEEDDPTD